MRNRYEGGISTGGEGGTEKREIEKPLSFPEVVTLRLTSECDYNCGHCFGPKGTEEMSLWELKKIFELLALRGARSVVLTGGEPMAREDFPEIVEAIKKHGLSICLDTNGNKFFEYEELITKNVDVLGLPIDFPDRSYRGLEHLAGVEKILDFYKGKDRRPTIRVGTVVTQDNVEELEAIGSMLKNYPVDIWKLYEFTPQNEAEITRRSFEVDKTKFDSSTQYLQKLFAEDFRVTISKRQDRNNAYFFINTDGTVFMPVDDGDVCRERKIGNIFDDDVLSKWEKTLSRDNYEGNIEGTFTV